MRWLFCRVFRGSFEIPLEPDEGLTPWHVTLSPFSLICPVDFHLSARRCGRAAICRSSFSRYAIGLCARPLLKCCGTGKGVSWASVVIACGQTRYPHSNNPQHTCLLLNASSVITYASYSFSPLLFPLLYKPRFFFTSFSFPPRLELRWNTLNPSIPRRSKSPTWNSAADFFSARSSKTFWHIHSCELITEDISTRVYLFIRLYPSECCQLFQYLF